jgi:hypothetical protein
VWYDLRDDGPNPFDREHNFGILDQDGSEKPAMRALRVLTNSARSHTYAGLVRDVPKGLHAMRLDGADDTVFIVWNDDVAIPARLRFTRDEEVSVTNLFGERIMVGDEIVLEEGIGPVYVRLKRH